jgi:chromosome segregation ATPase
MGSRLRCSNYVKEEDTMLKRGLIVWLVVLLVSSFSLVARAGGEGDSAIADKLAQIEAALSDLEEMVKDIAFDAQRLDGLESIVKEISFQMKSSEGKIRDLQAFQQGVEQDLRPRVVKLESSVAGLSFTVQKQGEKLTKLEGLSEAVAELQPRVFSLETTVEGLAAKLKTDEDQLKKLHYDVGDLQKRVESLETGMKQCQAKLKLVGKPEDFTKLEKLQNRLSMVETTLGGLSTKIDQNASQLADQGGRLASVESQAAALQDEVAKLRSRANTMTMVAVGGLLAGIAALVLHFMG